MEGRAGDEAECKSVAISVLMYENLLRGRETGLGAPGFVKLKFLKLRIGEK